MNALPPKLQPRVDDFLSSTRLGIDFGEDTAGIAVVKGREILDAVTALDYYEDTLEKRRMLRRNRRTRKGKKMRLARLRSWIYRQPQLKINGQSLDLYKVMQAPEFHPKPGQYRRPIKTPQNGPGWVRMVADNGGDPTAFIKALSLLFQKRGFHWEGNDLQDWTDAELLEFLLGASLKGVSTKEFEDEILWREENPDSERRGGKKKKPIHELRQALSFAMAQAAKPRVAVHRSIRDQELADLITAYCHHASLDQAVADRWKKELTGLLNKTIRPPRFENRLKSGCSWCGKPTAKKSLQNRDQPLLAALHNLRPKHPDTLSVLQQEKTKKSKEEAWRSLPSRTITPEEVNAFFKWLHKDPRPGAETIKRKLQAIGAQENMARQLHDLIANLNPKGRYNLCKVHMKMAERGERLEEPPKKAIRAVPNPCRREHEKRLLRLIEEMLFLPGKSGLESLRHGEIKVITLEVPEPGGEDRRAKKGEQKERHLKPLKERLFDEVEGICLYTGDPLHPSSAEIEHIFPKSKGGPDVQFNLTLTSEAVNTQKNNKTPWDLFGADPHKWNAFQARVQALARKGSLHPRKAEILLWKEDDYPEDLRESALTRVGQRHREFIEELKELFTSRGLTEPSEHMQTGVPLIQVVRGRWTDRLRRSWLLMDAEKPEEAEPNFPPKNPGHAHSHAEDAALLAATPPHTWREQIFRKGVRYNREKVPMELPDTALKTIAPDWQEFRRKIGKSKPIVRIWGPRRASFRRKFADETFPQEPFAPRGGKNKIRKSLTELKWKKDGLPIKDAAIRSAIETAAKSVAIPEGKPLGAQTLDALGVEGLRPRRVSVEVPPGGLVFTLQSRRGPARKIQIKPTSEGLVLWEKRDRTKAGNKERTTFQISVMRPKALLRLPAPRQDMKLNRFDPLIPKGARILGVIQKYQWLYLPPRGGHGEGWYSAREFSSTGVKLLPEWVSSKPALKKAMEDRGELFKDPERTMGKEDLRAYFMEKRQNH